MTSVVIVLGEEGYCSLSAEGHATGSQTVCAAVSALVYGLAGYLENAVAAGKAAWLARMLESGDAVLTVKGGSEVRACYEMTMIGLMQLAEACPDFIEVYTNFE